jgi:hypothetical protein
MGLKLFLKKTRLDAIFMNDPSKQLLILKLIPLKPLYFFFSRVGWKKPVWKKPLVLTGKNQTEKPRHFKGKTGFSWVFQFL